MRNLAIRITVLCSVLLLVQTVTAGNSDNQCSHDSSTVTYWENLRVMEGVITQVKGDDITLASKDTHRLLIGTYHVTPETQYWKIDKELPCRMDSVILTDKGKFYLLTYCHYCHRIFSILELEVT